MASIAENRAKDYMEERDSTLCITSFFKKYKISNKLKASNAYKSKGIPAAQAFLYLVKLVFTKKSMYMNIMNGTNSAGFAKDVIYRLLNATFVNWTAFLFSVAGSVIAGIASLTGGDRLNAIIIDDSLYERRRSKKAELLARVHDHAEKSKNKYKRGFRMLTMGWSDGVTFIPLTFRHLSSADKGNRHNEMNPGIDKRSVGYKFRKQAVSKAPDVLLSMLQQARRMLIPARHAVFDSWFTFPATVMRIRGAGFDVVARLKDSPKIKYYAGGRKQTLRQIYAASKKRRGRARYLLSTEVMLYNDGDEKMPARIVFVRDRSNSKKWIAFVSTDISLTEEQIIALYGKRWDIEVFFKICKSYLNLAREFYGLSYDSMTAHTTVVMTRYIILAAQKRQNEDPRSMGELFYLMYDEMADIQFADALKLILGLIRETLADCLFLSDNQVAEIISRFVSKLSACFKHLFSGFDADLAC